MPRKPKSLEAQIARGQRAKEILEDPVFLELLSDIELDIARCWAKTGIGNAGVADREWWHQQQVALQAIKRVLRVYMETGKVSAMSVEAMNAPETQTRGSGRAPR